jgi:hypothetical protein
MQAMYSAVYMEKFAPTETAGYSAWFSLDKQIAEMGLTQQPCPLRQNHVIIHSDNASINVDLALPISTLF